MEFFRIRGPDLWGDYGTVLAGGSDQGRDLGSDRLLLRRTGPFMPPITLPLGSRVIVVSESFRLQLASIFPHLLFRPVAKEKIVEIHWEEWDRQAPPFFFPEDGFPENYHAVGEHSPRAADGLGEIWELLMSEVTKSTFGPRPTSIYECSDLLIDETTWDGSHFFLTTPVSVPIRVVTETARQHLLELAGEWVTFVPVISKKVKLVVPAGLGARESKAMGGETKSLPQELTTDLGGGVKLELVLVPAGEFMMGGDESAEATAAFFNKTYGEDLRKADWYKDEHPQHRVRITQPFYLGACHVTRGQFRQFVVDTGYKTDAENSRVFRGAFGRDPDTKKFVLDEKYTWRNAGFEQTDDHPVVNVSWNDAVAFCQWLSRKEGNTYRLPTEAEWEYACRAGTTTRYYSGDDPETVAKVGNVADAKSPDWKETMNASDSYTFTSPVGSFVPNALKLYDMHGNVWQWCQDWYDEEYYAVSPVDDPTGPDCGCAPVLRGGSWYNRSVNARSAGRNRFGLDHRDCNTGFRVARTP